MVNSKLNLKKKSGAGKLYEKNGFLVPVLTGSPREMGAQYAALMVEHMQQAYNVLIKPGCKKGMITDADARAWTERIYTTSSMRYRLFYDGIVEGTRWPLDKVGMLDNLMEFSICESKMFSQFAGCTSILSWGTYSTDGEMYIGRNEDWAEDFVKFPQVLTVRRPTDGSYKYATMGWPGIVFPLTSLNEHGAYMDLHDGTGMGGSIICYDRIPMTSLLSDLMAESASMSAMVNRLNTYLPSATMILSLADESSASSMECSSLASPRIRRPDGDSLVVVNSFLNKDWGIGIRDSSSHSVSGRLPNMTNRLAENKGKVDAEVTRNIMDLKLYNAEGKVLPDGGSTKPINQDVDVTVHQVVTDVKRREMWLKVPVPSAFADWTHFDLKELWG